jgi:hypothetical protein
MSAKENKSENNFQTVHFLLIVHKTLVNLFLCSEEKKFYAI